MEEPRVDASTEVEALDAEELARAREEVLRALREEEGENARLRHLVLVKQLERTERLRASTAEAVHRRRKSAAAPPAAQDEEQEWREEEAAEIRRKVEEELLLDETASYLAAFHAHARDEVRAALLGQVDAFSETSALDPSRQCQVRHAGAGDDLVRAAAAREKHPFGRPLSLGRKLRALLQDWEARGGGEDECEVLAALNLSRAAFVEAQAEADESGVLKEAMENMGFVWRDEAYAFDEPDTEERVLLGEPGPGEDGPGPLRAATMDKVVERITHEHNTDLTARYVLLLTYRTYTDAGTLLRKLADRFNAPVPDNLTPPEARMFKALTLDRIQIRVCGVLKYWLQEHYHDFRASEQLREQLRDVLDAMRQSSSSGLVERLVTAVRSQLERAGGRRGEATDGGRKLPQPVVSARVTEGAPFTFADLSSLEVARQLTLLNHESFRLIEPRELLNQGWSRDDRETRSPNVHALTQQFERTAGWVQWEVLVRGSTADQRAATVGRFLEVARHCRALNNYHSLYAIYLGLISAPLHRLYATWDRVPASLVALRDEFSALLASRNNSKNLREALKASLPPCVPSISLFLSDLTFIDLGNKDHVGGGMVNMFKCQLVANRIRGVQQYQQESYRLRRVERIQDFLTAKLRLPDTDVVMFDLSKEVETREEQEQAGVR